MSPDAPTPPLPAPVRSAADALHVLSLAVNRPLESETLCFLLDDQGVGGVITVVSGTTRPDAVLDVVELFARVGGSTPRARWLVVASVRPRGGLLPGDIDRWLEASELASRHGVTLLEWFVIGQGGAQRPRDLLGEPERWPQPSAANGGDAG